MKKKYLSKKAEKRAVDRFRENIDMEHLDLFLSEHEIGSKFETFFAMLHDPAYNKLNFYTIAKKANVSIAELQSLYTDGMRHLGLLKMMTKLPAIMEDVAEDARTTLTLCTRCYGRGEVMDGPDTWETCPVCEGEKKIRRIGDKHARDLVFESAKLTHQSGPLVAIQNNIQLGDARMESMLKRTRQIALEPAKIKE